MCSAVILLASANSRRHLVGWLFFSEKTFVYLRPKHTVVRVNDTARRVYLIVLINSFPSKPLVQWFHNGKLLEDSILHRMGYGFVSLKERCGCCFFVRQMARLIDWLSEFFSVGFSLAVACCFLSIKRIGLLIGCRRFSVWASPSRLDVVSCPSKGSAY